VIVDIERALQTDGWMSEQELTWLAEQAQRCVHGIIEIGCFRGRTTIALADNSSCIVHAVDPFPAEVRGNDMKEVVFTPILARGDFEQNLSEYFTSGKVVHHPCGFESVPLDLKADLIFIDGDHHRERVLYDIQVALVHLVPGGVLAGHDYGDKEWVGVKEIVDIVFGDRVKILDTIWYVQ